MTNEDDKRGQLWLKLIIAILFLSGLAIGLAIKKDYEPIRKLQDNILVAINSSIIIREQSYGSIMFDLTEEKEFITQTDIIVEQIIQCESKNQMVWGDLDYYENGVNIRSFGIGQFQERTFNYLKGLADAPKLNYYSREDQEWLLKWAIEHDFGYLWTCWRLLYN